MVGLLVAGLVATMCNWQPRVTRHAVLCAKCGQFVKTDLQLRQQQHKRAYGAQQGAQQQQQQRGVGVVSMGAQAVAGLRHPV